MKHRLKNQGLISTIVIIVIALVFLDFFQFDVIKVVKTSFSWENALELWKVIKETVASLISNILASRG